jgi:hypothetical protein
MADTIDVGILFKAVDEASGQINNISNTLTGMANKVSSAFKVLLGAAVFGTIKKGIDDTTKAFGEAEKAEIRLTNAVKNNPLLKPSTVQNIKDFATQLQKTTEYEGDFIVQQSAMIAGMGLSEQQMLDVLKASTDLAANGVVPLQMAMRSLAQTYETGSAGLLQRYVPALKNLTKEQIKNGEAVALVAKNYKGMAEAVASGISGQETIFKNIKGDLDEAIGSIFAPLKVVGMKMIAPIFEDLTRFIEENRNKIINFFINIPEIAKVTFGSLSEIIKETFTGDGFKQVIKGMIEILIAGFQSATIIFVDLIVTALSAIPDIFKVILTKITDVTKAEWYKTQLTEEQFLRLRKQGVGDLGKFQDQTAVSMRTGKSTGVSGYQQYLREFEAQNIALTEAYGSAIDSMAKKTGDFLSKSFTTFDTTVKKVQGSLSTVGGGINQIANQKSIQDLSKKIEAILGRPLPDWLKAGMSTLVTNTEEIVDNTNENPIDPNSIGQGGDSQGRPGIDNTRFGTLVDETQAFFNGIFREMGDFFGMFGNALLGTVMSIKSVSAVMDPLSTILGVTLEVIQPIIDEILAPIIGVLRIFGKLLGMIIVPVLRILGPILEAVAKIFLWLYNEIFVPVGNFIIDIFVAIGNFIADIWNGIASAINFLLGWAGVNLGMMGKQDANSMHAKKISWDELMDEGDTYLNGDGGDTNGTNVYGGGTTVTQQPDIFVYQYLNGPVIGDKGLAQVGQFLVEAIQEYVGIGGKIEWMEKFS